MRFTFLFLVTMTAALFAACQPAAEEAPAEAPAEVTMSDEDMLDAQTDAFEAAWADADAAALAALFIEEADTVGPDGVRFHGREAIHGRYQDLLGGIYQGTTVSLLQESVSFPSPEVAIVHGSYEIHGMADAEGNEIETKGLFMNVAVKDNGEWKIHCSRPMLPMAAPVAGT